jgi:hypothetical protein
VFRIDRRSLFSSQSRSVFYVCAGVVLFAFVCVGFVEAYRQSGPPPAPGEARRPLGETSQPARFVPPAEIQYPFF